MTVYGANRCEDTQRAMRRLRFAAAFFVATLVAVPSPASAQHLEVTAFVGGAFPIFDGRLVIRASSVPRIAGYDVTASAAPELQLDGGAVFGTALAVDFGVLGIEGRWDATHVGFNARGARYDIRPAGSGSSSLAGSVTIGDGRFDLQRLDLVSINLRLRTPGAVGLIASGGLSYLPDIGITGSVPLQAEILGLPVLPALQPTLSLVATPEQAAHRWGFNAGAGIRVGGRLSVIAEARLFYFKSYDLFFSMQDALPLVNDLVNGIGTIRFNPIILNAQAGLSFRF
jgi:hypothetical protein